ncbi:MAG: integrase arm-type DNA-binding domain-containing protein [Pseudomonadota bacterium]
MALNKLTATGVAKHMREGAAPGFIADGGNLYLAVGKGTARSWVVRIKVNGKVRDIGVGSAHDVSLADARDKARLVRKQVLEGLDPIAERVKAQRLTFGQAANACLAEIEVGWKNPRIAARWRQILAEDWMKSLCAVEVSTVGVAHVAEALREPWLRIPTTAAFARVMIERVIDWSVGHGHREEALANPARWRGGKLRSMLPKPKKGGNNVAMPYAQLPAFYAALGGRAETSARLLQFILLTAVRKSEAMSATWGEVDLDAALWVIPASRMKGGLEHVVPLSTQAVALLRGLKSNRDPASLVFPSDALPDQPYASNSTNHLMPKPFTVHGTARSSFRDWAGDCTSFPRDIAEMALSHRVGDATELAYRRGTALARRAELMQAYADFLAG